MSIRDLTLADLTARSTSDVESDVALQMDEETFRGFYDRTARMLWVYLERLTGDRQAADDLLQETYYRFLRTSVPLTSESHRRRYLFRIATNLVHDRHRRRRAQPLHVSHDEVADGAEAAADTSVSIASRLDLAQAMAALKPRERAMLWLAYGQGATHAEIAGVVGVQPGSVKALLYRARRRLAALLGERPTRP